MKTSKKTKKLLGGVAIAAVSLGCLGLAGIANADAGTTTSGTTTSGTTATSAAYQLGTLTGAMTGTTDITVNVSKAQGETLSSHTLEYIKIGDYMEHGTSSFTVSAASQDIENVLYGYLTGGTFAKAYPNAKYTTSDGEALNWMLTGNDSGTYLGADASGQNMATPMDEAVRLLANYLYTNIKSLGTPTSISYTKTSDTNGYQEGTWAAPSPGVYLIVDTSNNNQSLPIILSTEPSSGYTVSTMMKNFITNQIALKTQDPQAMPIKQFVTGVDYPTSGDLTDTGSLSGTLSSTVGSSNAVTYQVSNVFPNTNGYQSYTYNFIDYPDAGLTLAIQGGQNMYVAGIPLSTLVNNGDAVVSLTQDNMTTTYGSASGDMALSKLTYLVGSANDGSELKVSINEAGMQYIQNNGYQTSNVNGNKINFAKLTTNTTPSEAVNGTTSSDNTMAGVNGGSSSYTGQTQTAGKGENDNSTSYTDSSTKTTMQTPQATGELFGLTYQGYLNSTAATAMDNGMPTTAASNTAETQNNGSTPVSSTTVPLTTSGHYNGTTANGSDKAQGTTQVNPTNVTHSDNGIPTNQSAGAGLNWMKIWGSGQVASGAEFIVSRAAGVQGNTSGSTQYLYATGSGWGWTNTKTDAQKFEAASLYSTDNSTVNQQATGGLFEISGLAAGTYTVTEKKPATGADPNALPSFQITLNTDGTEKVTSTTASLNLVNNTPNGTPFNSTTYNTVENVKSLSGLPLTGGAGVLTGVIAAVLLFGTAGIVLVVYKRRKSQQED